MKLSNLKLVSSIEEIAALPLGKLLVNTINDWSFVVSQKDEVFAEALREGGALIPDGKSIVRAAKFLKIPDAPKRLIDDISGVKPWKRLVLEVLVAILMIYGNRFCISNFQGSLVSNICPRELPFLYLLWRLLDLSILLI